MVFLWMKIAETTIFCQYLFHCNISVTYSSEGHVKVMKVISRSNADFTLKRSPIHSKNKKGDLEVDLEVNSRSDQGQTGFIPFPMIVKTV